MVEILGKNLKQFFDTIDNPPNDAEITYAGDRYEVWEVSDDLFIKMCDIFADDEGFQGLRVDCTDTFYDLDEKRDKLSKFIGCYPEQIKSWES